MRVSIPWACNTCARYYYFFDAFSSATATAEKPSSEPKITETAVNRLIKREPLCGNQNVGVDTTLIAYRMAGTA